MNKAYRRVSLVFNHDQPDFRRGLRGTRLRREAIDFRHNSAMPPSFEDLATQQYVSLTTFRRSGAGVAIPIWVAPAEGKLYAVTDGTSAKMKRLRVTDRIRLAPCDVRGKVRGEWVEGRVRKVEEAAVIDRAIAALSRKYGWRFSLLNFVSHLFGRIGQRAYLEITI